MEIKPVHMKHIATEESWGFDRKTIDYIQNAAAHGLYEIRGLGAKRRVPHFDDLLFLGASLSRYPLEGYREKCVTKTVLGTRFAKKPIELAIPITVAGMSFGALSANVKESLGRAATELGTSTTTGDGGMTPEERQSSKTLVYQCLPSRYGFNPDDVRKADAIEVVIGQGAKPGGGGMLLGQKISPRVAKMRTLPEGIDQRSASRHPDWTGPDDLQIKILELREMTDWQTPIYVKVGATRTFNDVKLAVHAGADVIVVDGMQGGTAATQTCFIENVGIPTLAALRQAVDALEDLNMKGQVQLIISGGIRSGADVAKALAMGADAVAIGQGVLVSLGCNSGSYIENGQHVSALDDYASLGTAPGFCHHCHTGKCPVGITTQNPVLQERLKPDVGAKRLKNYLKTLNMELTTIARACGKQNVHHLEPEDLVALTVEAAAMARVPLAGTNWIPGLNGAR
ncbi:Glutamate synthase [NADPH] large chain (plasmid) [Paraburkholderia caribensis MBA4]|jgi:methylamine---glutamate N-methyltransferase subunit C|uniref:N-methylglutamate synthase subunit C n=4 Tax=Paraburkholderia TaxID=1822464 RepID=A0A7Z7FFH1_9BURK|nr:MULTISPECIES: FMN-binding glutamate synthase family protein [Paraburkholderia]EUC15352.1 Glutamate synthase (NADPH) [Burkholderia sp. BT03]SKC84408.1 N-methylglutamate synthase subunit C precursor [Burkholderia sp. CF099]SOE85539.1 N-methylglutamate synthase subunit C precursor [Burkholderia sp. YR290]ALL70062.1 Glutamate synthase [NADPH] large chain [Paraburkholderia caribensis MBA4]AUT63074.1 FMN-binding glutamate synthase family protein [Paraburkholderia terrae]